MSARKESSVLHAPSWAVVDRNRRAVDALLDYTNLPYVTLASRPDAAYITVATLADLHRWAQTLREQGGTASRVEVSAVPFWGFETWAVLGTVPPGRDGYRVPLRVAVLVPAGSVLPVELHDLDDAPEAVAS